jgi:ribosomal protein S18 acetylase RimI-like enzyme
VRVHRLTGDDRELLDAALRTFRGDGVADPAPFLADPASIAFVALEDGEVIGWAWGFRQRHVRGHSQVQLYEIDVVERARRRGVGRTLLLAFRELAVSEGHRKLWLVTTEDNLPAQALYRSAGGQPSPHAGYWWPLDNQPTP